MPTGYRAVTIGRFDIVAIAFLAVNLFSCAAPGPRPLSITMFHPEKKSTLDCAARDLGLADRNQLADAVEGCARMAEKSGYLRQSGTPKPPATP